MQQKNRQPLKQLRVKRGKPYVSYAIIVLCLLIFTADQVTSYMIRGTYGLGYLSIMGMKINEAIQLGQWWRIVTSIFLHGDVSHVGFNMLAVYVWGRYVEGLYGNWRYVLIFLLAGIIGSLASFAFTPNNALGASGAIYGMFGALLYFRKYDKQLFNMIIGARALVYMGISLVLGFTMAYVDNIAHIGGLAGGYLAARIVGLLSEKDQQRNYGLWIAAYLVMAGILMGIGYAIR